MHLLRSPEPTIMKKITIEGAFSRLLRTGKDEKSPTMSVIIYPASKLKALGKIVL